jgi:hypothetical protein
VLIDPVILNPSLVVAAGGVRVLTQVLSEGPFELSDTLSLAFVYLLDLPATRKYLRAGNDLEVRHFLPSLLLLADCDD